MNPPHYWLNHQKPVESDTWVTMHRLAETRVSTVISNGSYPRF